MPTNARRRALVEDRDALMSAAEAALEGGSFALARELAERAVRAADLAPVPSARGAHAAGPSNVRSASRCLLALASLYDDRVDDAERIAEEARRIAQAARAPRERALAELAIAGILRVKGDQLGALKHAARARGLAARTRELPLLRSALAEYALALSSVGDGDRARVAFDEALAIPDAGQPKLRAFHVLHDGAAMHRAAGRYAESLALLDRAEAYAGAAGLVSARWALTASRIAVSTDIGAFDVAEALLLETPEPAPAWQRAEAHVLSTSLALAAGQRPETVERLATEGLALEGLGAPARIALERLRATALLARGRADEAERVAVDLTTHAARGGAQALAAQAMALAARATGRPEAALLRWLGALGLSMNGVAARVEHESMAALAMEPDPIGTLARSALSLIRARLIERTPPAMRATMKRTLRAVESKLVVHKQARRAEAEVALGEDTLRAKDEVGLVGSSPALLRAIATLARASKSDTSLVITGETGSGKELFARLAHRLSPRAAGPFVAINCAAIPEPLLEAELFGHERGAFTGADRARPGLFVEAQGGTLFLDEIGEMSAAMQAKLLRVLEEHEVRAIGGGRARKIDVRVLAATHRELKSMVLLRTFREDLFYRLAAITVRVPSLRERPEDIPTIARAVLARDPQTAKQRLDVPALTALAEHAWPGNVRELANVLRVAAALSEGNIVGRDELTEAMQQRTVRAAHDDVARPLDETTLSALRSRHRAELRELVGRAIASADGNKLRAARALGISRQGLYRVLGELTD